MSALSNLSGVGTSQPKLVSCTKELVDGYVFEVSGFTTTYAEQECYKGLAWRTYDDKELSPMVEDGKVVWYGSKGEERPTFGIMYVVFKCNELDRAYELFDMEDVINTNQIAKEGPKFEGYNRAIYCDIPYKMFNKIMNVFKDTLDTIGCVWFVSGNEIYCVTESYGENNTHKFRGCPVKKVGDIPDNINRLEHICIRDKSKYVVNREVARDRFKDNVYMNLIINNEFTVLDKSLLPTNGQLEIMSNYIVTCDVPIYTDRDEEIYISGNGKVLLTSGEMQPCIGESTHTGMSYGRWTPVESIHLKSINISGDIEIYCLPSEDNFSLGAYNYEEVPQINITGNAKLVAPEMEGKRVMVQGVPHPDGSTKFSGSAVYKILKDEEDESSLLSDEQNALLDEIVKYAPNARTLVKVTANKKTLERALELLQINPDVNVTPLLQKDNKWKLMQLTGCVVLGLDPELAGFSELKYEVAKIKELCSRRGIDFNEEHCTETLIAKLKEEYRGIPLTDWDYRVVYESIPSYFFSFDGSDVKLNVDRFLES